MTPGPRLTALCTFVLVWTAACGREEPSAISPEGALWETAIAAELPAYPERLVERRVAGVTVSELHIRADGTVRSVRVVESPDPVVSDAVRAALLRWRFTPLVFPDSPTAYPVEGKITLYFDVRDGKGLVQTPAERARENADRRKKDFR